MRIITVSGARSGVGKTTLALLLISRLKGFAAIKVSHAELFTSVTDDPEVISREGKDTALMKGAGASAVVWVQSEQADMAESLSQAMNMLGDAVGVVVEGNSPARLLEPDVSFYVAGVDVTDAKDGALDILKKADVVVVNVGSDELPDGVDEAIRGFNSLAAITTMGRLKGGSGELDELVKRLS